MISLSAVEKHTIVQHQRGILEVNGIKYIYKPHFTGIEYSELIAEKLCNILGIRCAHYEAVRLGNIYYLSKYLGTEGKFIPGEELHNLNNNLYDIWQTYEKYFGDPETVMDDLVKIYLFDLIFLNSDRDSRNFGIVNKGNETHIYAIDHEYILDGNNAPSLTSKYSRNEELKSYHEWPTAFQKDSIFIETMHELEFFLSESDSKYFLLLQDMISKVPVSVFRQVCDEIEVEMDDEIAHKEEWIKVYEQNYNAICQLIEFRKKTGR